MGKPSEKEDKMNPEKNAKKNITGSYGSKLGYSIFEFILKYLGLNLAYGILIFLIPYYVILRPGVYMRSKPYLLRRFPHDSFLRRYLRLFKYIFIFGQTLIDQFYFGIVGESKIRLDFDRQDELLDIMEKRPMIFIMSHLGFWEVSMAGSSRFNKIMNVMADKDIDKDKRKSYYDIHHKKGLFRFINVTGNYGGMIEATNALLRGEVVGVMGDRAFQWRSKKVNFLGSPAKFPIIAEQLAIATGASLIVILTSKKRKNHIVYKWKDISTDILSNEKLDKEEKIQRMLELYVKELEKHVHDNPYLWFNFFDFWGQ